MAVTDPEQFKKISKSVETMKSFREGDLKKLDDSVKEFARKNGINADNIRQGFSHQQDDAERQKLWLIL
jgi:hypothetical protein